MTEGLAFEPPDPDEEPWPPPETTPDGWLILDPGGSVIASGGQTVTEASADAGEET